MRPTAVHTAIKPIHFEYRDCIIEPKRIGVADLRRKRKKMRPNRA